MKQGHCKFDVELSTEESVAFKWLGDTLTRMVANGSANADKAKLCLQIIATLLEVGAKAHEEIHDRDVAGAFLHLLKKIGFVDIDGAVERLSAEFSRTGEDVN